MAGNGETGFRMDVRSSMQKGKGMSNANLKVGGLPIFLPISARKVSNVNHG